MICPELLVLYNTGKYVNTVKSLYGAVFCKDPNSILILIDPT